MCSILLGCRSFLPGRGVGSCSFNSYKNCSGRTLLEWIKEAICDSSEHSLGRWSLYNSFGQNVPEICQSSSFHWKRCECQGSQNCSAYKVSGEITEGFIQKKEGGGKSQISFGYDKKVLHSLGALLQLPHCPRPSWPPDILNLGLLS